MARQTRPDVLLLDLRLPDMLASEAVKLLRMAAPRAKIVIFTAYAGHRALKAAMEAGVDGCLLKDAADTDLVEAIRRVARGESVYDARLDRDSLPGRAPKMPGPELTRREYEVLRRVAIGETNPEIAEPDLAGQACVGQKPESAINRRLSDARILGAHQTVKIFSGHVSFSSQKHIENQIALRRALQALLLDVFKENFLLFGHRH